MVKATKGRQKIQMEKMKNESSLQVTFSKRRTGLFKKASELSTLCGVDIAIIVFSPGGKAYSFGHPSVEAITDRFLSNNNNPQPQHHHLPNSTIQLIEASRNNTVRELNFQLTQALERLELEKIRGEQLNKALETINGAGCPTTVEEMNLTQLQEFKLQLENLKIKMTKQAEQTSFQNLNHQQLLSNNNNNLLLTTTLPPQLHQQQQPWSLPFPQLQYPLLLQSPLGVGVGPSSVHHQLPLAQSIVVANAPYHHFWGNLTSSSSSMPHGQGRVDATTRNGEGAVEGIMQPTNMGMLNNYGSRTGSSSTSRRFN